MDLSPLVLHGLIARLLEEDVGYGDITTLATVPPQAVSATSAMVVPGPGRWTLALRYRGRDVAIGLAVSALAWSCWLLSWPRRRQREGGAS